jgi:acetyl-CoA carboxylase biotin carboxyl carrier protein
VNLTDRDVQDILRLLESSGFDELNLETDRFKLTLRRAGAGIGAWTEERHTAAAPGAGLPPAATSPPPAAGRQPAASAPPAAHPAPAPAPAPASASSAFGAPDSIDIHPPFMGTFYRAPKPGAPPFVEKGSRVTETTVIGIVETMKLMNSVYAGARGEVVEICAANGQLVEQHHVLMRLAPERP